MAILGFVLALALAALTASSASATLPIFPGAEGFGTDTAGGRGGQVLAVNVLGDDTDGSCDPLSVNSDCTLREAIEEEGCRIVIFRIGGTIMLDSPLNITEGCITIAGQSAPGDGIQIRNDPVGSGQGIGPDSFPSIQIEADDVVIRYLRVRPGTIYLNTGCTSENALGANTCKRASDIIAVNVKQSAEDVVLDHLSLSYAVEEMVSISGARNVTLSNSIVAHGLDYIVNKFDAITTASGKGVAAGQDQTLALTDDAGRFSIHHNLFAHSVARLPQMHNHCLPGDPIDETECFSDAVNNVSYNWAHTAGAIGVSNLLGNNFTNIIANFVRSGPDTYGGTPDTGLRITDNVNHPNAVWDYAELQVHIPDSSSDYHTRRYVSASASEYMPILCRTWELNGSVWQVAECDDVEEYLVDKFDTAPITTTTAAMAWDGPASGWNGVPEEAGAIRTLAEDGSWIDTRDALDSGIVDDVRDGTGHIVGWNGEPNTEGMCYREKNYDENYPDVWALCEYQWRTLYGLEDGYPELDEGTAPDDGDNDGMPDVWEIDHCMDEETANDDQDMDADGYHDIEEFLNGSVPFDRNGDNDNDGVDNDVDKCRNLLVENQGDQVDHDSTPDGIGDFCDCDFDGGGTCTPYDAALLAFCDADFELPVCAPVDMNNDGDVDNVDVFLYYAAAADGVPGPGAPDCES